MRHIPPEIEEINLKWMSKAPFLSEFLFRFTYHKDPGCKTIGVSGDMGNIHLWIGTNGWWDRLSMDHKEGVLVHEIDHLLTSTIPRSNGKEHHIFNKASDVAINWEIEQSTIGNKKLTLPRPGCFLSDCQDDGYAGEVVSEDLYEWMLHTPPWNDKNDGDGNGGSGGKPFDDHSRLKKIDEITKQAIKEAARVGKMRGYGSMSANMKDRIEGLLKPRINWMRQVCAAFNLIAMCKTSRYDDTWTKVNRKGLPIPGRRYNDAKAIIAVDVSGSISKNMLRQFMTEIEGFIKRNSNVLLLLFDTQIKNGKGVIYKPGDWTKIDIIGGGGTDPQCVFDFMKANKRESDLVVFFTDGEFSYHFNKHRVEKILWCVEGNPGIKIPHGNTIHITNNEA